MSYPGVTKTYAIQRRELRVIVGADKIDDKQQKACPAKSLRKSRMR